MSENKIGQPEVLPIGCIIMASGEGSRFGGNKLLAPFKGQLLIENILNTVSKCGFAALTVVTRHQEIAEICQRKKLPCLLHDLPGQNDTVYLGLKALYTTQLSGYLFCVGDQPLLTEKTITALCRQFLNQPQFIHRPCHAGTAGNPIIFPKKYAAELMQLPQNKGGAYVAKKYPEQVRYLPVQDKYELFDIDTEDDLQHLELLTF